MLLPRFSYLRPKGLEQALEALAESQGKASVLAGGTDLLVNMKAKRTKPEQLVSLSGLDELARVAEEGGSISIGSAAKAAELAGMGGNPIPQVLAQAAGSLGSPQVRNLATIGGNIVTARPAGDMCVALLALGAKAALASAGGERLLPLDGFFQGPGATDIKADEILTRVLVDKPAGQNGGAFFKLGLRRALEIALVSVAVQISLADDGKTIAGARVALGAVAPIPMLSPSAARALIGSPAGEETFAKAAEAAAGDAKPIDDHRGSAAYRRDMVENLTKRTLGQALQAARG